MKILVIGSDGMLGKDLMSILSKDPEVLGVNQSALQLGDFERVREIFTRYKPVVVIHTAEVSDLDRCEAQPWETLQTNAMGTQNVVSACLEVDAALIHVSTDQVFSGARRGPYVEWDTPRPVNLYGHSKLASEIAVREHMHKFFLVRTSSLYGRHGSSFVTEVLQSAREGHRIRVASDEVTCPTFTQDLARALARLAGTRFFGTYHITNTAGHEGVTWAEFAQAILEEAGHSPDLLDLVPGASLGRAARRPARPVLGNTFFRMRKLLVMRPWREALKAFFKELSAGAATTDARARSPQEQTSPSPDRLRRR